MDDDSGGKRVFVYPVLGREADPEKVRDFLEGLKARSSTWNYLSP